MMVTTPSLLIAIGTAPIHPAIAFSWSSILGEQSTPSLEMYIGSVPQPQPNAAELGLTPSQMASVFLHNNELEVYASRSDCFADAVKYMRTSCENYALSESERIQTAIAWTLCELATAKAKPPQECATFRHGSDVTKRSHSQQASCVEALHRSTQHWSSYSGYLRQAPELCHAYRAQNNLDGIVSLYRDISTEKVALLKMLQEREVKAKYQQDDLSRYFHSMQTMLEMELGTAISRLVDTHVTQIDFIQQTFAIRDDLFNKHEHRLSSIVTLLHEELSQELRESLGLHFSEVAVTMEQTIAQWDHLFERFTRVEDSLQTLGYSVAHSTLRIQESANMSQQILGAFSQIQKDADQISEDYQRRAHWRPGLGDFLYWVFNNRSRMRDVHPSSSTVNPWQQPFVTLSSSFALLSQMTLLVACIPFMRLILKLVYVINMKTLSHLAYLIRYLGLFIFFSGNKTRQQDPPLLLTHDTSLTGPSHHTYVPHETLPCTTQPSYPAISLGQIPPIHQPIKSHLGKTRSRVARATITSLKSAT